jgi:hypothetical protein
MARKENRSNRIHRGAHRDLPQLEESVTCRDEKDQTELLGRLKEEGRGCTALLAIWKPSS